MMDRRTFLGVLGVVGLLRSLTATILARNTAPRLEDYVYGWGESPLLGRVRFTQIGHIIELQTSKAIYYCNSKEFEQLVGWGI